MIEVEGLRKLYGDHVAVDGVGFTAQPGTVFGLLGPNGAGKSTTIGCISGLLTPTAGRVRVLGHDVVTAPRAARAQLGVVPQELALYEEISAAENLRFWGSAYGLRGAALKERVREVLSRIGLLDRSDDTVKTYSGGMKRRLNLGCAILHRPKVLLLDEPTVGVDPQSRVHLLDLVRELVADGTCVLYTSHTMDEAEELCDEFGIVDHGKLIASGTLEQLRGLLGERDLVRLAGSFDQEKLRAAFAGEEGIEVIHVDDHSMRLATAKASRALPLLLTAVERAGGDVRETIVTQPSLETLFIKLTGKELRE